jgi:hypothetical protein
MYRFYQILRHTFIMDYLKYDIYNYSYFTGFFNAFRYIMNILAWAKMKSLL